MSLPLVTVPRMLVVPRSHPLLKRKTLVLEDLARYPLIAPNVMAEESWGVMRVFRASGIDVHPAIYAMDASVMKRYVEEGGGIAIVSGLSVDPKRDRGIRALDVSHLFEPSLITAMFDPLRFMRGYEYEFIELLTPSWTRSRIEHAVRQFLDKQG